MNPLQGIQSGPVCSPFRGALSAERCQVVDDSMALAPTPQGDGYARGSAGVPSPPASVMAEAAEPVESDSGITGKSLVVAGALALSLVPGLVGCASLGPVPAPSSVSVSSTMVQVAVVNEDGTHLSEERAAPIKDAQKQAMAEIATGTSEDDGTAPGGSRAVSAPRRRCPAPVGQLPEGL